MFYLNIELSKCKNLNTPNEKILFLILLFDVYGVYFSDVSKNLIDGYYIRYLKYS